MPDVQPSVPALSDTTQPQDAANVGKKTPQRDSQKMAALGVRLMSEFSKYERERKISELRWLQNFRQFIGEYDPEIEQAIGKERSHAYPKLTRIKVISMLSRMMNLLFPSSEKNYTIAASPIPNLETEDLDKILASVQQQIQVAQSGGTTIDVDAVVEAEIRAFARKQAEKVELICDDQLAELGGSREIGYVALARKVLLSGIMYGAGVLKGPLLREQKQRKWISKPASTLQTPNGVEQQPATLTSEEVIAYRPHFEFVPLWDYYPDMSAKYLSQMDGQYHRLVFSRQQVRELADLPTFFGDTIEQYLKEHQNGNYKERTYETMLRTMGVHLNVNPADGRKFEIYVWDGFVRGEDLKACGVELSEKDAADIVEASVWILDNQIIRAEMSPWAELEPDERVKRYHHFIFEEDDAMLMGNGLPNIMRDSQMGVASATRMLMDNASIVCAPSIEVNTDLMEAGPARTSVQPWKTYYREGTGKDAEVPAVREIKFDAHIEDLSKIIELFEGFADKETFVNPATGGDMQKGPSEPFRTAAGASMIQGNAALPFKDVVRNFDVFTVSMMNSLLVFNRHFHTDPATKGDHQVVARGATSLIAKEVRGMQYDALATTLQPEERIYMDWYKTLKDRCAVRDISPDEIMCDSDEAKRREQAQAQEQQDQKDQTRKLLEAEIRKLLAEATKALTQGDKNAAAGAVAFYNAVLKGLEGGLTPGDVDRAGRTAVAAQTDPHAADGGSAPPGNGAAAIPPAAMQGSAGGSFGGNGAATPG